MAHSQPHRVMWVVIALSALVLIAVSLWAVMRAEAPSVQPSSSAPSAVQ